MQECRSPQSSFWATRAPLGATRNRKVSMNYDSGVSIVMVTRWAAVPLNVNRSALAPGRNTDEQSDSARFPATGAPGAIGAVPQAAPMPETGRVTGDPPVTPKLTLADALVAAAGLKRKVT